MQQSNDIGVLKPAEWYTAAVYVFYRAAWSSDENSVCPSVCPSVKGVDCDKTEEKSVQIFIPY